MFASTVNLLLANSGSRGTDLLRALINLTSTSNLMSKLVEKRKDVAREWIKIRPNDISSLPLLDEQEIESLYGPKIVKDLALKLGIEEKEVVRLLNVTLYRGVQLVAPDGEHVSERAAKRLDEDLEIAITPHGAEAIQAQSPAR